MTAGAGCCSGGVPGVPPARVVVIGGGVVGHARRADGGRARAPRSASSTARSPRLRELDEHVHGAVANPLLDPGERSSEEVDEADVVIGAVLVPGASAPKLVTRAHAGADEARRRRGRRRDRPGRLLRDLARDDARRSDLRGRRRHPLLRRQHAWRRAAARRATRSTTRRCRSDWRWPPRVFVRCSKTGICGTGSMFTADRSPIGPSRRA